MNMISEKARRIFGFELPILRYSSNVGRKTIFCTLAYSTQEEGGPKVEKVIETFWYQYMYVPQSLYQSGQFGILNFFLTCQIND